MSYFVIKGPGAFGQYLTPMASFECPQWWHERDKAMSFPDADSARKWLRSVQERYSDHGSYAGRVVRVNTVRDWKAERRQLRSEIARLRAIIPTCERGPKACDAELADLRSERDRLREGLNLILAVSDDDPILETARKAVCGCGDSYCGDCAGSSPSRRTAEE